MAGLTPNQERHLPAETGAADPFFITVWYPSIEAPDVDRLQAALAAVVADEPALRTGFEHDPEHGYRSVVRARVEPRLRRLDVTELDAPSIAQAAAPYLSGPQDLSDPAALQHYFLARSADGRFALVFSHHPAISDGRSLDIFIERVAAHYSGASASTPVPPAADEPAVVDEQACADYFRRQFQAESSFPTFHRDRDAPSKVAARSLNLGPQLSGALQDVAASTSPFSVLAAAFAAQVHGQTGSTDVLISIQTSGRGPAASYEIGSLSNTVAINVRVEPDDTFRNLARRIRELVSAAVKHEALPYHRVRALTGAKADFALDLRPDAPAPAFEGLSLGQRQFLPSPSDYGVNLRWQRRPGGGTPTYEGEAWFDEGAIDPQRIEHFLSRQRAVLAAAVADPDASVRDLLEASRRPSPAKALPASLPTPRLFDLFRQTADQRPAQLAVRYRNASITYGELAERVEGRAAALAQIGLCAGDRVAFIEPRSADYVVTLLALSRLGATFAAFDPAYPLARMAELAEAFVADWILAAPERHGKALEGLSQAGWRCADIPASGEAAAPAPQPPPAAPSDIAYCLFTSGTTGRPRAVGVGHSAIPAFVEWQRAAFDIDAADRVSMLSGLSHDPIMRDIFLPLTSGGALLVPDEHTMHDPRALSAWLVAEAPTVIHATPPLGRLLSAITDGDPALPGLRYLFWGGDMLTRDVVETFQLANPSLQQVNFYGSTETPQAVAYHLCGPEDQSRRVLPVGQATGPARISVIDADQRRLETNEVGEVLVETPYHVVTQAASADDEQGGQSYRTGDRGYLLPDQSVMLIGRADDQVKIRGYRVELADVTRHIRALDDVADAIVLVSTAPDGEAQLIAHVVARNAAQPNLGAALRQKMSRSLPSYMVPGQVIAHAALPLLPNGKIDRAALRETEALREGADSKSRKAVGAFSDAERRIADVFAGLLGRAVDSPDQTFADLGADSLNSVHAMLRLEAIIPQLPDDWYDLSVAELAALLPAAGHVQRKRAGNLFRSVRVDPAVVLRAAAIILIVAFHYKLLSVGGGLTFVLFMLAGVTFARFQLGGARDTGSTRAIARGLAKIAIISFPISLVMGMRRVVGDLPGGWRMIGFSADFIDFSGFAKEERIGVWLWFIGCYLQIMLAVLMLLRLPAVRRALATNPVGALLVAFLAMASLQFALPAAFNPGGLGDIRPMSVWMLIPTAHAGTFLLGALLESTQRGSPGRWAVVAAGVSYALATGHFFPGNEPLLTTTAIVLVGLVAAFPLPRIAALVAVLVSQASLYIYLLHGPVHSVLTKVGLGSPAVSLLIAVPLIIASAAVFDRLYDRVAGGIARGGGRLRLALAR